MGTDKQSSAPAQLNRNHPLEGNPARVWWHSPLQETKKDKTRVNTGVQAGFGSSWDDLN
jgi:hypothetical protein